MTSGKRITGHPKKSKKKVENIEMNGGSRTLYTGCTEKVRVVRKIS